MHTTFLHISGGGKIQLSNNVVKDNLPLYAKKLVFECKWVYLSYLEMKILVNYGFCCLAMEVSHILIWHNIPTYGFPMIIGFWFS